MGWVKVADRPVLNIADFDGAHRRSHCVRSFGLAPTFAFTLQSSVPTKRSMMKQSGFCITKSSLSASQTVILVLLIT